MTHPDSPQEREREAQRDCEAWGSGFNYGVRFAENNQSVIDDLRYQVADQTRYLQSANDRIAELESKVYVPGLWRCAKCKLNLVSSTLNAYTGAMHANDKPHQCPNGCGPMWRVTERDERKDAQRLFDREFDARTEAEAQLSASQAELAAKDARIAELEKLAAAISRDCNETALQRNKAHGRIVALVSQMAAAQAELAAVREDAARYEYKAHQFDTSKVNRVEVIDQTGRAYVYWKDRAKVDLHLQDDGRTLKVFISDLEAQQ